MNEFLLLAVIMIYLTISHTAERSSHKRMRAPLWTWTCQNKDLPCYILVSDWSSSQPADASDSPSNSRRDKSTPSVLSLKFAA
jgi:hypothetical protein